MPVAVAVILEGEEPEDQLLVVPPLPLAWGNRVNGPLKSGVFREPNDVLVEAIRQEPDRRVSHLLRREKFATGVEALEHVVAKAGVALFTQNLPADVAPL